MSIKNIIAIVGVPGAGKSEASSFFRDKNIPVVRFGEVTDDALTSAGLPLSEEHEKTFRESLRQELGMAAFAIKSEPKIREALKASDIVVLDGVRSWEECVYLKEKFTNLHLLAIYASPRIRHQRLEKRKVRGFSEEEARKRDIAEVLNLHIAPTIALADYLIKNETTLEDLHQQLEKFLKEINPKSVNK